MIKSVSVFTLLVSIFGILFCAFVGAGFKGPVMPELLYTCAFADLVFIGAAVFSIHTILTK